MPWEAKDASSHKKGLTGKSSQKWAKMANAVLSKTGDEGQAIRIANSRVANRNDGEAADSRKQMAAQRLKEKSKGK